MATYSHYIGERVGPAQGKRGDSRLCTPERVPLWSQLDALFIGIVGNKERRAGNGAFCPCLLRHHQSSDAALRMPYHLVI